VVRVVSLAFHVDLTDFPLSTVNCVTALPSVRQAPGAELQNNKSSPDKPLPNNDF